jgi:hypothetical protein
MESNIRLLEDRVRKAAHRLRELSSERDRLSREVEGLKERLADSSRRRDVSDPDHVSEELQEAIRELRTAQ